MLGHGSNRTTVGDSLPTEASWQLPTMGVGDTQEKTVTVFPEPLRSTRASRAWANLD